MIVFIDTNVILDLLERREPHADAAAMLFTRVEQQSIEAFISAITVNNVFYIARRSVGRDAAWEYIRRLRTLVRIVPLDEPIIDEALKREFEDFEDGIQAAAAARARAAYIISRDVSGFRDSTIQAITAEELLAILDS